MNPHHLGVNAGVAVGLSGYRRSNQCERIKGKVASLISGYSGGEAFAPLRSFHKCCTPVVITVRTRNRQFGRIPSGMPLTGQYFSRKLY